MNLTPNYGLKKPTYDEFGDVQDLNDNADIIDTQLKAVNDKADGKADKVTGKGLSTNDYTTAEKTKLAGLSNYDDAAINARVDGVEDDLEEHIAAEIGTETGVHGMRFHNDKLEFYNGTDWVEVETGGTGIPPLDCSNISMTVGNTNLTIKWTDPEDTVISGSVLSTWAGTKLVRKAGSFPTSPTDGVLVVDNKTRNAYASTGIVDSGLVNGTTYYYQLFPYNTTGGVNTNATNRITGIPQDYVVFGVSIDLTNSDPSTAVTYTDAAIGMNAGAAWDSMPIFKDIKPCVLKNGVVQHYLNPANFAQKADGTNADITSGSAGDVMIEIPKTGFKIMTSGTTLTIKVTDNPNDTTNFKYYAHTRATEGDRNKLYIGAYLGYSESSKLRSLSGKTPTASQTIGAFRTLAQTNGTGYDMVSFYPLTLLQCLYLIKFKSLDSQTALGRGYVDGNSAAVATGGTNAKSMNFGETTGKLQMKFLGIEDMWGNLRWWIDGLYSDSNRNMMTAFRDFNDTGTNYANRGQGATANIGNYMSKPQGTSEAGFIAKEVTGSATTYFSDYAGLSAGCLPYFGGYWSSASVAGVFFLNVYYAASSSAAYLGARLMYL